MNKKDFTYSINQFNMKFILTFLQRYRILMIQFIFYLIQKPFYGDDKSLYKLLGTVNIFV